MENRVNLLFQTAMFDVCKMELSSCSGIWKVGQRKGMQLSMRAFFLADRMFDIGSNTDTNTELEEVEDEIESEILLRFVDPIPVYDTKDNPWAEIHGEE